jgi:hypothetical protein
MLQEELVDSHAFLLLLWNIGNACEEPFVVDFSVQAIPKITEIHFEWRVRHDVRGGPAFSTSLQHRTPHSTHRILTPNEAYASKTEPMRLAA